MAAIETVSLTVRGTTALCMHCAQAVDPLCDHPAYKPFKKISTKRNKTEEDHLELARLEWLLSLYVNSDGKLYLPGRGIEAAMKESAKRRKLGKKFNASVMVEDAVLRFPDETLTIDELWLTNKYRLRKRMKVGTASIMRTTPRFPEWSLKLDITFMPAEVDADSIISVLADCGSINGMFEFRPHYGRFEIVK